MSSNISKRGLASLSPERKKEIALLGSKELQRLGKRHKFTHDEAVSAGKLGGIGYRKKDLDRKENS